MKNIYLLHGWTYSLDNWQSLLKLLEKQGLNPIQLQIPGLTAPLSHPWTIDNYVDWLKKETINEKTKLILIGHSNGGRISLNFALKYPQIISHLILIDSGGIYDNGLLIRFKRRFFKTLSFIGKKITNSKILQKILYRIIGESNYFSASPIMRQTMINLLKSDKTLDLNQLTIPVTIIWGKNDTITPLSHAHKLHTLLTHSELHIITGARHVPFFTHPEETLKLIINSIDLNQIKRGNFSNN